MGILTESASDGYRPARWLVTYTFAMTSNISHSTTPYITNLNMGLG